MSTYGRGRQMMMVLQGGYNLLPLSSTEAWYPKISGFAEDDKVLLIGTDDRIFTIQLESMKFVQFKICFATLNFSIFHPFSSVYTAGNGIVMAFYIADVAT